MSEERNISVSRSDIPDFHEALAWAVQRYDQEFTGASMVKISVEQTYVSRGEGDEWHYQWTAAVFGQVEAKP